MQKRLSIFGRMTGIALAVGLLWVMAGCQPTTIDAQGHQIFNPNYLFYLESDARDKWQKPDEVLKALELSTSAVIADIGAGGGYFTEKFSKYLDASGRVYATDVQQIMIEKLQERVTRRNLNNVEVLRGEFDDPLLPPNSVDLVFFSSVYKEIDGRTDYMKKVRDALKPGGRVAIIEFRPGSNAPGPPLWMRLTEEQVIRELDAAGFRLANSYDFLPREYFLIFSLADS